MKSGVTTTFQHPSLHQLFRFAVRAVNTTTWAVFVQFKPSLIVLAVFLGGVVALFALSAGQRNHNPVFFLCHDP
jgi:hypothetical protein